MKKIQKLLFASAIIMSCGIFSASAQTYVHDRPQRPEVTRGEAPSPQHVWVNEEWHAKHGQYQFTGGHYAKPPHAGYKYKEGHWNHSSHGESWTAGSWHK